MSTFFKEIRFDKKAIRKSARGANCLLMMPGCRNDRETVVFAHLDRNYAGKGKGVKAWDLFGLYSCAECHSKIHDADPEDLLRAMVQTQKLLVQKGLIK